MIIHVEKTMYREIEPLRNLLRHEAHCQVVKDSIISRGLADPYLITVDGRVGGYGGVWNQIDTGDVMEFYALPAHRVNSKRMFAQLLEASHATGIGFQSNIPWMASMLYDFADEIWVEAILFSDSFTSSLVCEDGEFRHAGKGDFDKFKPKKEGEGDWVLEVGGEVVATGGYLTHYNPPYGDVFMEVDEAAQGKGYGSYLVQEVKRICYEQGKVPAARTSPNNLASRRCMEKAGFLPCGRLLRGKVKKTG